MVPSSCPPVTRLFCAQRLLSRLQRPAPPRSEFGEGSRGAELVLSSLAAGAELWGSVVAVVGGLGRAAHTPACAVPPLPSRVAAGWEAEGLAVGSRSHSSPVRPRAFRRVRPSRSRPRLGPAAATRACRAWCVLCALGLVRLSPRSPFLGGVPTAGGIAGFFLPFSGLRRVRVSRDWSRSRGRTSFWETGGRPRPARRRTSGPAAARGSSSVGIGVCAHWSLPSCWRLLGLPGGCWFRVGSAPQAGVVGLRREVCGVIPARLPRVARSPTRAVSRWPCVRAPSVGVGPAVAAPCRRRRPSFCRVVPTPRHVGGSLSPPCPRRGLPAAVPSDPPSGGRPGAHRSGRSPGFWCWGREAGPAGGEELRFGGASRPRGCGRVSRGVRGCVRGDVPPRGIGKRG